MSAPNPFEFDCIYIPGIWSEATGGIATRYFVRAIEHAALIAALQEIINEKDASFHKGIARAALSKVSP